jgi:hypothetical protein
MKKLRPLVPKHLNLVVINGRKVKRNNMKLGEFIKQFSHNNIVRLHYKIKGGHKCVLEDWNDVSMDHEIVNGKGKNRHYINNEVLGLAGIYFQNGHTNYPEAINIVIEELENQPMIEEVKDEQIHYSEAV